MTTGTNVTTCLWFEKDMQEAVNHYVSLFEDARVTDVMHMPDGTPLSMTFEIHGRPFVALAGAPVSFNDASSMFVTCRSQDEIDRLWDGLLSGGGKEKQCGWLTDRFGVSWQIVPEELKGLLTDPDGQKAGRTMHAMLGMVKLDIEKLKAAHGGEKETAA